MEMEAGFFYETLNIKDDVAIREEAMCQEPEEKIEPPTKDEVWEIKRILKNNTSPGEDNISVELIKYRDKRLWDEIHTLMEGIRASERMSENWQTAVVCPIHKGDKRQCSDYRRNNISVILYSFDQYSAQTAGPLCRGNFRRLSVQF